MLSKLSGLLKIFVLNFYLYHSWSFCKKKIFKLNLIDEAGVRAKKNSNLVFIIGSGYSLNSLSTSEIEYINANDVITFNNSHMQDVINSTFHLSRRIGSWRSTKNDNRFRQSGKDQISYLNEFKKSNMLKTILLLQWERYSYGARICVSKSLISRNIKIYPYETIKDVGFVRRKQILNTLLHKASVLTSALDFAFQMGWEKIVLVGFDLDKSYFWLEKNKTSLIQANNKSSYHSSVANGIIEILSDFQNACNDSKIDLFRDEKSISLLEFIDIFKYPAT